MELSKTVPAVLVVLSLFVFPGCSSDSFNAMHPRGLITAHSLRNSRQKQDFTLPAPVSVRQRRKRRDVVDERWHLMPTASVFTSAPQVISFSDLYDNGITSVNRSYVKLVQSIISNPSGIKPVKPISVSVENEKSSKSMSNEYSGNMYYDVQPLEQTGIGEVFVVAPYDRSDFIGINRHDAPETKSVGVKSGIQYLPYDSKVRPTEHDTVGASAGLETLGTQSNLAYSNLYIDEQDQTKSTVISLPNLQLDDFFKHDTERNIEVAASQTKVPNFDQLFISESDGINDGSQIYNNFFAQIPTASNIPNTHKVVDNKNVSTIFREAVILGSSFDINEITKTSHDETETEPEDLIFKEAGTSLIYGKPIIIDSETLGVINKTDVIENEKLNIEKFSAADGLIKVDEKPKKLQQIKFSFSKPSSYSAPKPIENNPRSHQYHMPISYPHFPPFHRSVPLMHPILNSYLRQAPTYVFHARPGRSPVPVAKHVYHTKPTKRGRKNKPRHAIISPEDLTSISQAVAASLHSSARDIASLSHIGSVGINPTLPVSAYEGNGINPIMVVPYHQHSYIGTDSRTNLLHNRRTIPLDPHQPQNLASRSTRNKQINKRQTLSTAIRPPPVNHYLERSDAKSNIEFPVPKYVFNRTNQPVRIKKSNALEELSSSRRVRHTQNISRHNFNLSSQNNPKHVQYFIVQDEARDQTGSSDTSPTQRLYVIEPKE